MKRTNMHVRHTSSLFLDICWALCVKYVCARIEEQWQSGRLQTKYFIFDFRSVILLCHCANQVDRKRKLKQKRSIEKHLHVFNFSVFFYFKLRWPRFVVRVKMICVRTNLSLVRFHSSDAACNLFVQLWQLWSYNSQVEPDAMQNSMFIVCTRRSCATRTLTSTVNRWQTEKKDQKSTSDISDIDDMLTCTKSTLYIYIHFFSSLLHRQYQTTIIIFFFFGSFVFSPFVRALALDNLILVMRPCSKSICFILFLFGSHFICMLRRLWRFIYLFILVTIHTIRPIQMYSVSILFYFFGLISVRVAASWGRINKCVFAARTSVCECVLRAHDYTLGFVIKFIGRAYLARHM